MDHNVSEEELTRRLIGKDFGAPPKGKPKYFKSLVTGIEYSYDKYINHGRGGIYRERKDLPANEYPYTIVYEIIKAKWQD